ncbi:hypothetical protein DRP43_00705 [candidate division TA06 bacterium]|uniref:HTH arsR-type domain-containing protein n=1 Tax=candidate division TA06 bacterium TaxID=2250710 RepID=A0A660SNZ6_UNCT6|nr:MAG: hypothetical protein DRP43_00705 [candidate division TA06 bacterium]
MIELFNKYAPWKILRYFALHPSKGVYVKEIAKKLNLSAGICSKILRELLELQILEKNNLGQAHYYKLADNYITKELKRFIGLSLIYKARIIENITDEFDKPTSIVLYGSYITGEFNEKSDIDILVIGSGKQRIDTHNLEEAIGKEINIEVFSIGNWLMLKKKNDSFYTMVIKDYILLYGSKLP